MSKKIPERSEIAVENTWRLEDLYGSDELWQADLVKFQQQIDALTGFAGKISQSAADLLAYMKLRDEISILADRLGNYAMRRGDQDTRNSHYQGMVGQFMKAYVEAEAKTSFETPELLSISDEKMEEFYREEPELELYRRYFDKSRSRRAHILSATEEKLLAAAADTNAKTICLAGGVAANGRLRQLGNDGAQKLGAKVYLPELKYCGDNGAMIAAQGYYEFKDGNIADLTLNGLPTLAIDYR
mgnify:CR=1 FL=1